MFGNTCSLVKARKESSFGFNLHDAELSRCPQVNTLNKVDDNRAGNHQHCEFVLNQRENDNLRRHLAALRGQSSKGVGKLSINKVDVLAEPVESDSHVGGDKVR